MSLSTAADNITGTVSNDTINGVAGTVATFSVADIINGGAGTDTLSIVTDNNFTVVGANVTSVERLQVNATAAAIVTLSNVTGLTDLINSGSSATAQFGVDAASAGAVNSVVNLTLTSVSAATSVSYSDTALTGTADAMTLTLNGAINGSAAVVVQLRQNTNAPVANQLETLNISSATNASNITLTTDATQTSLKTINVTGSANLALGLNNNVTTSATTINASAFTGNLTVGTSGTTLGAANHNVTTGTGNDTVWFGANLNSSDTVDLGAGSDTLGVTLAVTNAIMTNVKNVEAIRYVMGADVTQDAGLTSVTGDNYLVSGAFVLTLNNLANAISTTVVGNTTTLSEVLKDSTGLSDNLTVAINNGAANAVSTLTTLTAIAGLETLNLSSGGGTGTNVITNDNVAGAHVLTGSAGLTITNALAATSFNASAFTGKLSVLAGATASNIVGGTGADTIVGGTAADTLTGGAGNDTLRNTVSGANATAADVMVGGAGNDVFQLSGSAVATGTNTATYALVPSITDFTVGTTTSATDTLAIATNGTAYSAQIVQGAGGTNLTATAAGSVGVLSVGQSGATALAAANQFIKLNTGVAAAATMQATFNAAIGTATLTGGTNATSMVGSLFDTTNGRCVIFECLNTNGTNGQFETGDVIRVIGAITMTAADYATFGTNNIALVNF